MTRLAASLAASAALAAALAPMTATAENIHYAAKPPPGVTLPSGAGPAFSAAVQSGKTLYVSGTTDGGTAAAKPGEGPEASATRVMENFKRLVETGGATMDDLVWVQIFCTDLSYYNAFNTVYRGYFKGPLPSRAFIGTNQLLGGAVFEVMGIAVKP